MEDDLEDASDLARSREVMARIEAGEEETVPAEIVMRLLTGENPVRVWREHRKMTAQALSAAAGVANSYLSEIETGKKPGSVEALSKIARALGLTVDDLLPPGLKDSD